MATSSSIATGADPSIITIWNGGMGDPANAVVNEYSVLSIPAFWSGVRFISETLGTMPKAIYQRQGTSRQPVTHSQNKLLSRKANRYSIPAVVFETWHSHAVIHGNGYLFIERNAATSQPVGYHPLNPSSVTPFRYEGEQWYLVRGGQVKNGRAENLILPAADVAHLPGLGFDGMVGYPLVWLMFESLELARNSQRFASRYLKKGTQVQGAIEIPAVATKEQVDTIVDRIRRSHNGIETDYSFMVLTGGAKQTNATIPPEQSQLLQSRQFCVLDMCRILRVPPHIVYELGRATYSNLESLGIEVVKYSLMPWVTKAEQELSSKLLTEAEQDDGIYIRYSVDSLLRGDTATVTKNVLDLVNGGILVCNEGRALLDLAPIDDPSANKLRVPVNFPVAAAPESTTPTDTKLAPTTPDTAGDEQDFVAFAPLIADVAGRVEAKTAKAFTNREGKPQAERTIWANVFAEEQARFVSEALSPIAVVVKEMTGQVVDTSGIAEKYAIAIRAKAAGHGHKTLAVIINESINSQKLKGENK